jgi:hypothetical protein
MFIAASPVVRLANSVGSEVLFGARVRHVAVVFLGKGKFGSPKELRDALQFRFVARWLCA